MSEKPAPMETDDIAKKLKDASLSSPSKASGSGSTSSAAEATSKMDSTAASGSGSGQKNPVIIEKTLYTTATGEQLSGSTLSTETGNFFIPAGFKVYKTKSSSSKNLPPQQQSIPPQQPIIPPTPNPIPSTVGPVPVPIIPPDGDFSQARIAAAPLRRVKGPGCISKFCGVCRICGKRGHMAKDCWLKGGFGGGGFGGGGFGSRGGRGNSRGGRGGRLGKTVTITM